MSQLKGDRVDYTQRFLVVIHREEYHCGESEIEERPATAEEARNLFVGVDGVELFEEVVTEKQVSKLFKPEIKREIVHVFIPDEQGSYRCKAPDGEEYRARSENEVNAYWVSPEDTESWQEWHKTGEDFSTTVIENNTAKLMHLPKDVRGQRPRDIHASKTIKETYVFVHVPDIETMLEIVGTHGEIALESFYNNLYHKGHGKFSSDPVGVTAMIIE